VRFEAAPDWSEVHVPGNQRVHAFHRAIPADFSTATFFLVAGALGDNAITCTGLDMDDPQSDKAVVEILAAMGADVQHLTDGIRVAAHDLYGIEVDLNDCPDTLPMLAVLGCFASGRTVLRNVPQARIKETDRIAVMAAELKRMGGRVRELRLPRRQECPCQKQPCTNRTTAASGITKSGRPGSPWTSRSYGIPSASKARATVSSGPVSRLLT